MIGKSQDNNFARFRHGDQVEVRRSEEILATLDADGKVDGLPLQAEMLQYCGRTFEVYRRAGKVFLDRHYRVARLDDTVLLKNVRCSGKSHGGCKMGCLLLWKESWLKPAGDGDSCTAAVAEDDFVEDRLLSCSGDRFICQATELPTATSPLPWWNVRQYVGDLTSGELTLRQFVRMLSLTAYNKAARILRLPPYGEVYGQRTKTPDGSLELMPGELVEVKSKEEIRQTLDEHGKNRGLGFGGNMVDYCGGQYRVANRVDRLILEWSGEMRNLSDTVVLKEVVCDGLDKRGCPRACYHLWREIWLKRVP